MRLLDTFDCPDLHRRRAPKWTTTPLQALASLDSWFVLRTWPMTWPAHQSGCESEGPRRTWKRRSTLWRIGWFYLGRRRRMSCI